MPRDLLREERKVEPCARGYLAGASSSPRVNKRELLYRYEVKSSLIRNVQITEDGFTVQDKVFNNF